MSNSSKYLICKTLDEPTTLLWRPIEEVLPALILVVLFTVLNTPILGLCLGVIWFNGLRFFKKGQSITWLYAKLFWYMPSVFSNIFLKKTPSSDQRNWIA